MSRRKIIGIYKITNIINNKVYIGQSIDIYTRWSAHKTKINKKILKLYNSVLKYGLDNFTFDILIETSVENLNYYERCFQELYNSIENGYNCIYTKTNEKPRIYSTESKLKMSNASKNKPKMSDLTRLKMSLNNIGKKKSYETRLEMSKSAKLKPKVTQETKLKMSKYQKGKIMSEEAKIKMSISQKKRANEIKKILNKPIIQYSLDMIIIKEFESIESCRKILKINPYKYLYNQIKNPKFILKMKIKKEL